MSGEIKRRTISLALIGLCRRIRGPSNAHVAPGIRSGFNALFNKLPLSSSSTAAGGDEKKRKNTNITYRPGNNNNNNKYEIKRFYNIKYYIILLQAPVFFLFIFLRFFFLFKKKNTHISMHTSYDTYTLRTLLLYNTHTHTPNQRTHSLPASLGHEFRVAGV